MLLRHLILAALSSICLVACNVGEGPTDSTAIPFEDNKPPAPGPDVEPVQCEPGAMYVCDCGSGNLGNKFCSWSGAAFSECLLCGNGAEYVEDTGVACDKETPCQDNGFFCAPLSCYSGTCWVTTALPRAEPVDAAPNDCRAMVCDGFGNAVEVPDPHDCNDSCNAFGDCAP